MVENDLRPDLPVSLKKKRKKRIIIRIGLCCLLLAVCVAVVVLYAPIIFSISNSNLDVVRIIFSVLLLCVPFAVSGVPFRLIDSSWSGTVSEVSVEEDVGTYTVGGKVWPYTRQNIVLLIQKDDGETVKYTAFSLGVKEDHNRFIPATGRIEDHISRFNVGDRAYKYYGYKYLYIVSSAICDEKRCLVCGQANDSRRTICLHCYSELM